MSKWKVNIKRPFFDDNIKKIIYDILCLLLFSWYREIAFTSLSFRCHLRFLLELTLNHIKFNAYVCNVYTFTTLGVILSMNVCACTWYACVFVCMMGRAGFILSIISFCSPNIKAIRRWFFSFFSYDVLSFAFTRFRSHSYSHSCSHFSNLYESRTTILKQPFLRFFYWQFLCSFPPTFNGFKCKIFAINRNSEA